MLSNFGGGINLHDDNGDTPLLLAARLLQPTIARLLLQKGKYSMAIYNFTLWL